ncbi:PaaI family thioesterase [Herbiconiux moechotypicola]|uniref:PaaI family thioesterase n=1 Tax=Herbiconiux moechotypicola TaxID=637393 RepID=A0ABP5QH86_9MICO|nr:PaaI family thioesterase [Herbiconiux moechotypicola]MCS5730173.1 PaaI family thioesterase [Herbiconiux moechotypicola]
MALEADDLAANPPAHPDRSRLVEWNDPHLNARQAATMPGRDYLEGLVDGSIPRPPMGALMGMRLTAVGDGTATFVCTPDESHYNTIGIVHGGLVCTLLDSAVGCAVQSTLPAGVGYTSIELKVSYLRPLHHDSGEITCVGTVVKPGRRVAFAEGVVTDAQGKTIATATSSLLVFPL